MRARFLPTPNTFPLVRSQDFFPQKMRQNSHVFPRFIPAAHRRMILGLHVFPRLTRCMFFCAQQQLHVFRNLVTSWRGPWERGWFPRLEWLAKSPSIVFLQMVVQCRIQLYPALHDNLSFASHFPHDSLWQFVSNSHYRCLVSNSPG